MTQQFTTRFTQFCKAFDTTPESMTERVNHERKRVVLNGVDMQWNAAFIEWTREMWTKFDPTLTTGQRMMKQIEFDAWLSSL